MRWYPSAITQGRPRVRSLNQNDDPELVTRQQQPPTPRANQPSGKRTHPEARYGVDTGN
jgi:hypothetical protein